MINTVLRDNLHAQIEEILVDDSEVYQQTVDFVNNFMPDFEGKIVFYENALPLFTRNKIEKQSNRVFDREVTLPSGGQIVLDPTEAFLAVDVNSAKSKYKNNFADMVLNTNLQAVDELFNQICLRDIGGLIVVDFIDMNSEEDIRKVQERVERACQRDRHRTKSEQISKFGLMQLQRRRTKSSIYDTAFETCDTCSGHGRIRTVSSIAHQIFHEVEAKCYDKKVTKIRTHVTPDVAAFLTNELRSHLSVLEIQSKSTIEVIPDLDGENSTYVTHSYRSQYSNKPRETESFSQGKPNSPTQDRKRNGTRSAPAKSIETAAVSRSDIEKRNTRTRSRPDANSRQRKRSGEKRSQSLSIGASFRRVASSLTSALSYLYRRLFVVSTQPSPSVSKRGRSERSRPTQQRGKTEKTGPTTDRRQTQRGSAQRQSSTPSRSAGNRRASARNSRPTDPSQSQRTQRRSTEASPREQTQTEQKRKENQRAKAKTSVDQRDSGTSKSTSRESQRTQRQRQSSDPVATGDTSSNQSPRTVSAESSSRKQQLRQPELTPPTSEPSQEVIDSSSDELKSETTQISSESESTSLSVNQESERNEAGSEEIQENKEVNPTDGTELTKEAEAFETLSHLEAEASQTGDSEQDADISLQTHSEEVTSQTEEAIIEPESVSSNGQDDNSESARASNDPRNRLSESVESTHGATIQVS